MSRFANLEATERWVLPGGCQCPGEPHGEGDWIRLRTQLGVEDALALNGLSNVGAVAYLAREWNLLDDDGQPVDLTRENVGALWGENFDELDKWIDGHVRIERAPKASGGRSGTGTRATARHARRRTQPSTKS